MKAKGFTRDGVPHVVFCVPSQSGVVVVPLDKSKPSPYASPGNSWTWNGDTERPTLSPSVNCPSIRDHFHITDGMVAYCSDCAHKLASQTVEMPDLGDLADMFTDKEKRMDPENTTDTTGNLDLAKGDPNADATTATGAAAEESTPADTRSCRQRLTRLEQAVQKLCDLPSVCPKVAEEIRTLIEA